MDRVLGGAGMIASSRIWLGIACLGAGLAGSGCQTYQVGQVLPSAYHMRDDVQYFPRGSHFPLANELNAMQAAQAERQGEFR